MRITPNCTAAHLESMQIAPSNGVLRADCNSRFFCGQRNSTLTARISTPALGISLAQNLFEFANGKLPQAMNAKYQTPILEKAGNPEEFQNVNANLTGRVTGATWPREEKMFLPAAENFTVPAREGRCRAVIENVAPEIDAGRVFIKRTVGETVTVEADIFADGHDSLSAVLKFRFGKDSEWVETPMVLLANDRWRGQFAAAKAGSYFYTVAAWVDHFKSWQQKLQKKIQARQNISAELQTGVAMIEAAARRAPALDAERLEAWAEELRAGECSTGSSLAQRALDAPLTELMSHQDGRKFVATYEKILGVVVDPVRACFGAWHEIFPRSTAPDGKKHGTFKDCEAQLPRIAKMGFDILYFPPIHPIGKSFRKGTNNNIACAPGEPGSPWAIGSDEGGHKAIHPELGTLEDFRRLVDQARELKIESALDIAFQCSPDHPYIREHPDWFRDLPDGSIQYAENPPKLYQDIVPFDFECDDWENLWLELKSIFDFWIRQGVRIFRVDNPHTKTFAFWEWCLAELKKAIPNSFFYRRHSPGQSRCIGWQNSALPSPITIFRGGIPRRNWKVTSPNSPARRSRNFFIPTCGPTRQTF